MDTDIYKKGIGSKLVFVWFMLYIPVKFISLINVTIGGQGLQL